MHAKITISSGKLNSENCVSFVF